MPLFRVNLIEHPKDREKSLNKGPRTWMYFHGCTEHMGIQPGRIQTEEGSLPSGEVREVGPTVAPASPLPSLRFFL